MSLNEMLLAGFTGDTGMTRAGCKACEEILPWR
jgi:hypothetical protein